MISYCKNRSKTPLSNRMHSGTHLTPPAFADALIKLDANCGGEP